MSSDSSHSAAHSESDEETADEAIIYQHLSDLFVSTPLAPDQGALFEAAAQHLSNTLERAFTAGEVKQHVNNARTKRKRRRQTIHAANSRLRAKQARAAEHEEKVSSARTRRQHQRAEEEHGPAPPPPTVAIRSASIVTSRACALIEALDDLHARSRPSPTGRGKREGKEEAASEPATERAPLADITNQPTDTLLADDASSSYSPTDADSTDNASSSSSPPAAPTVSTIPTTRSSGLLSAGQRITIKQQKRDLKKELADATASQVQSEIAARQETVRMVGEATKLLAQMNKIMPAMGALVELLGKKHAGSEAGGG